MTTSLPLNRELLVERIRAHADRIRESGATALYVYGSYARGEADADSDLDVFVDYVGGNKSHFSLTNLITIAHIIEDELGLPVDITTRDSLSNAREAAEQDALRVI